MGWIKIPCNTILRDEPEIDYDYPMESEICADVANETFRAYWWTQAGAPRRLARRIKRKFGVKVDPQELAAAIEHYRDIYHWARMALKDYLRPPQGEYSSVKDVNTSQFLTDLIQHFPRENESLLNLCMYWVIDMEYLR